MNAISRICIALLSVACAASGGFAAANAPTANQPANPAARPAAAVSAAVMHSKINAWTVGLAGGELEGAPIRFASDIARVTDDGNSLHVLPIVTRGPTENIEDLLYLKGVDAAIINTDALTQFEQLDPSVRQKITYILSLFPSELHVFVRPEINSLADLDGKKVNFNTPGTTAAYSGPLIFEHLKLDVIKTFVPHPLALQEMRNGEDGMAAVVFITSKPVAAFLQHWPAGFRFLPIEFRNFADAGFYLPSRLTSSDYPDIIPAGQEVHTIAIPTVLAAFNWPIGSDRYERLARMTDSLFQRLNELHQAGFQPQWKNVNANARVPGLQRFPAAQRWLDRAHLTTAAAGTAVTDIRPTEEKLYQEFLQWRKTHHQ
ncbi:MAG TPA: hypothetical protein VMB34_32575 [Acetobacteraceae bacterium]|nr:hypothetical protein [Acetobacteraceae bacterium]